MNWFNGRDFSDAVAKGVRKGLQPTVVESFMNAYNQSAALEAGFRAEREALLQSHYEVLLNGVKNGVQTPEVLVADNPFHLMIVRFSVLRHPDIYRTVDIESWLDRVRELKRPKKDNDVPEAIVQATSEINGEFESAGYDVDQLMVERERWIEFDEAWSELDDIEQATIEKFGRVFSPKYKKVADIVEALSGAGLELQIEEPADPSKSWRKLNKEGLVAFASLEYVCNEHENTYTIRCSIKLDPSDSLDQKKVWQRQPNNERTNPLIAGDGWEILIYAYNGDCDCADKEDIAGPLIEALGGEFLELPEWLLPQEEEQEQE